MRNDMYGTIRALVLIFLIATFVVMCITDPGYEEESPIEEPTSTIEPTLTPTPTPELPPPPEPEWESQGTYILTAYCSCEKCCGYWATVRPLDDNGNPIVYTATGAVAQEGTTIAVDPDVIPYGSEVKIGDHTYIAQDTGGAIKGNRIDVYFDDHQAALEFGRQEAEVFLKKTP